MMLPLLLLLPAPAQVTEYTDHGLWEADIGRTQCADFVGLPNGTVVTDQYASLGMTFTEGNDSVLLSTSFVVDGAGVNCSGNMTIAFSPPVNAVGFDFPGALKIEIYSGSSLVWSSSRFAGTGTGFFAGLISTTPFDRAVVSDWIDHQAYVDNVCVSGGFGLDAAGACPGTMTLTTSGGTAAGAVAVLFGAPGSTMKPDGVCAGTFLQLSNPRIFTVIIANGSGVGTMTFNAPAVACGRTLQAVDLATCGVSNTVVL